MLTYTAFLGYYQVAQGSLEDVALKARKALRQKPSATALIFSDSTGKQMDIDLQGSEKEILESLRVYLPAPTEDRPQSRAGRPRLGVVPREISLLPAHWEFLSNQSAGASQFIRDLVEQKWSKVDNRRFSQADSRDCLSISNKPGWKSA